MHPSILYEFVGMRTTNERLGWTRESGAAEGGGSDGQSVGRGLVIDQWGKTEPTTCRRIHTHPTQIRGCARSVHVTRSKCLGSSTFSAKRLPTSVIGFATRSEIGNGDGAAANMSSTRRMRCCGYASS